jgi:hypothetical protein
MNAISLTHPTPTAPTIATPSASVSQSSPWIISRNADLAWFQGSVLAGLALVAFFAWLPPLTDASYGPAHPVVLLLLAWGVLFDGTHVYGTYARTYLAPDAASRAALPGSWSWSIVLSGPAVALLDHALCVPGPSLLGSAGLLFRSFLLFAYVWAYWHLVRQHYGFLALYRRRANDVAQRRVQLDTIALWVGCLYPYVRFSLGDGYLRSGLPQTIPPALAASLRSMLDGAFALAVIALVAFAIATRPRLGPRHLLVALVVGFHLIVFAALDNLLTITAALTIFHNLQYHRIVWQYERGHGRVPAGSLLRYLTLGSLLGLAWYGPRIMGVALVHSDLARNMLLGLGWGVAFHHYFVDGRIWRVRRGPVAQAIDAGARAA